MRRLVFVLVVIGCGGHDPVDIDAPAVGSDAPNNTCQPQSAIGNFYRRQPNPRIIAGHQAYTDGKIDVGVADPDLRWDDDSGLWQLYFHGPHAQSFGAAVTQMIRHATSLDLAAWSIDDAPSLQVSADPAAWDHLNTETPTVAYNPNAAADRRYLLLYSGANGMLPNYSFANYAIGAAFSADGKTFTRVPASESPHGKDGLVLTGTDVYPGAIGAIVADPEVAFVNGTYHLWYSSFACTGTSCATITDYGIAHSTSTDGIHWTTAEAPVRSLLRASVDRTSGGAQPSVIYDEPHCRWELWMRSDLAGETDVQPVVFNNMAGVWHATSTDAVSWTINFNGTRDLKWNDGAPDAGEHLGLLTGTDVAMKLTGRYMIYGGFDDQLVPGGFLLPNHSTTQPGVMTLNLATRDAP